MENLGEAHRLVLAIFMLIGVVAFMAALVELRMRRRRKLDTDYLFELTRMRECSEFDIFIEASRVWGMSEAKVEDDFNRYLRDGQLPTYVSQHIEQSEVHSPHRDKLEF